MAGILFYIIELIGVISFAVSGAMIAIKHRSDIFGVVFLGCTTALGGGATRDIMLGNLPPSVFTNWVFVIVAGVSSMAVFMTARVFRDYYLENSPRIETVNNVIDALGLGAFTVTGINSAFLQVGGNNILLGVFMGTLTGIGGGVLRDLLSGTAPVVFKKHVYALASIAGGIVYCLMINFGIDKTFSAICCMLIVFAIRVLATVFKWNLPRAF